MQLGPPRFCANTKDNTIIDNHLIVEVGKVGESAAAAAIAERVRRGWGRLGWGRTLRGKDAVGRAARTTKEILDSPAVVSAERALAEVVSPSWAAGPGSVIPAGAGPPIGSGWA